MISNTSKVMIFIHHPKFCFKSDSNPFTIHHEPTKRIKNEQGYKTLKRNISATKCKYFIFIFKFVIEKKSRPR